MSIIPPPFPDRADAGRRLAARLLKYKELDPIVLGIPGSGMAVAEPIAEALGARLETASADPDGAPSPRREAVARMRDRASGGGSLMGMGGGWSQPPRRTAHTDAMGNHGGGSDAHVRLPDGLQGRVVILVDDGLHDDQTVHATMQAIRRSGASQLIFAVPVAARASIDNHDSECDHIEVLHVVESFTGAKGWYIDATTPNSDQIKQMVADHA